MTDLSSIIGVGLNAIERKANDLVQFDNKINCVLGELVTESYLDSLAEEVNEKLQQNGSITIAEIAKLYDLPGDFLLHVSLFIFCHKMLNVHFFNATVFLFIYI